MDSTRGFPECPPGKVTWNQTAKPCRAAEPQQLKRERPPTPASSSCSRPARPGALRPCQHILSGQALHHDLRVAHEAARGEALPAAHVHTVDLLHLAPEAEAQLQHLVADRWQEELGESRQ